MALCRWIQDSKFRFTFKVARSNEVLIQFELNGELDELGSIGIDVDHQQKKINLSYKQIVSYPYVSSLKSTIVFFPADGVLFTNCDDPEFDIVLKKMQPFSWCGRKKTELTFLFRLANEIFSVRLIKPLFETVITVNFLSPKSSVKSGVNPNRLKKTYLNSYFYV